MFTFFLHLILSLAYFSAVATGIPVSLVSWHSRLPHLMLGNLPIDFCNPDGSPGLGAFVYLKHRFGNWDLIRLTFSRYNRVCFLRTPSHEMYYPIFLHLHDLPRCSIHHLTRTYFEFTQGGRCSPCCHIPVCIASGHDVDLGLTCVREAFWDARRLCYLGTSFLTP